MLSIKKFKNEANHTSYDFSILYEGDDRQPNLFGLISLSSKKASDLSRAIGIVSDFVITKFQEKDLSLLARLGSLQRDTVELIMSVPIDDDDEIDFYLGLLSVSNDTFYVYFEQEFFNLVIRRGDKVIWINKHAQTSMFTGSGKLMDEDEIFLLTKDISVEEIENGDFDEGAGIVLSYRRNKEIDLSGPQPKVSLLNNTPEVKKEEEVVKAQEIEVEDDQDEPDLEEVEDEDVEEESEEVTKPVKRRGPSKADQLKKNLKPSLEKVKNVAKSIGKKLVAIAKDTVLSIVDFFLVKVFKVKKPTLIKNDSKVVRTRIGFIFIVIFLLLALFLGFKSVDDGNKEQTAKKDYETTVKNIDTQVAALKKNATPLNNKALNDIPSIQQNIAKARLSKFKDDKILNGYEEVIQMSSDKINVVKVVLNEDIFTVISAKFPGSKPSGMTLLKNGNLVILDSTKKTLYQVSSKNALEMSEIKIDKFNTPQYISSIDDRVFVYDSVNGLYEVDVTAKTAKTIPGFTNLGNIRDFQTYGDNIYLLSDSSNKLWRSVGSGSSFSFPGTYNSKGPLPAGVSGFTIDGKVFIATDSGILQRYFSGELDSDSTIIINGLKTAFNGDIRMVTVLAREESNTNYLYIMDPGNARILKVNKDNMTLEGQYLYRGDKNLFKNLKTIVLSSDEKTMYALDLEYIFKFSVAD